MNILIYIMKRLDLLKTLSEMFTLNMNSFNFIKCLLSATEGKK